MLFEVCFFSLCVLLWILDRLILRDVYEIWFEMLQNGSPIDFSWHARIYYPSCNIRSLLEDVQDPGRGAGLPDLVWTAASLFRQSKIHQWNF